MRTQPAVRAIKHGLKTTRSRICGESNCDKQGATNSLRLLASSRDEVTCAQSFTVTGQREQGKSRNGFVSWFLASAMVAERSLVPALALPLFDGCRGMQGRYSSSQVQMPDVEATGGIVEIPLAQTGEGIADCELITWFVKEVQSLTLQEWWQLVVVTHNEVDALMALESHPQHNPQGPEKLFEGDEVEEFAPICEVQSDKASVVITSRYKGKISQILFMPGDVVKVGETLLEMILEGSNAKDTVGNSSTDGAVHSSEVSESLTEDTAPVNREEKPKVLTTPAVRNLAKTYGINLSDVVGTGKDGRITNHDVLSYVASSESVKEDIQSLNESPLQPEAASPTTEMLESSNKENAPLPPDPNKGSFNGEDIIIPVRGYRRAMAKAMTAAAAIPHFHYMEEIEVNKLVELKSSLSGSGLLKPGAKLTYLPFLIKSLSTALQKYPVMNSTVNEEATEICLKASHNIGVAIATNFGLVVPNIKCVQRLSVLEIATELSRLIQLAGTNMLSTEDITGGTITVSNFGAIGGKFGCPLLNSPEVAIVAIGRMQEVMRPLSYGNRDVANVLNVTWGADHRVIDGATVARFCNEWKLLIEEPERLLLHLR